MEWKMEKPGQREININPSFFDNTEELIEAEGCDKAFLFKEFIRLQNERKELDRLKHQIEYEKEELKQEMTKWTKQLRSENDRLNQEKLFFDKKFKILENGFRQLSDEKESLKKEKLLFEAEQRNTERRDYRSYAKTEDSYFFRGVTSSLGIKKRYKDLIKIFHPDNLFGDTETIQAINKEYERLKEDIEYQRKA